jgi:hypothetical protein
MRAIAVAISLFAVLSGCADDDGNSSSVDRSSASETAVAYTSAVAEHDYEAARAYVAAASRDAFDFIADAPDQPDSRADGLSAGNEDVEGDRATVVILGKLCTTEGGEEQCMSNDDAASTNPLFVVHMTREDDAWSVYFPTPKS